MTNSCATSKSDQSMRIFLAALLFTIASLANGQVEVENIQLDTLGKKVVSDIIIEGNKVTKARIILRESTLQLGDSLYWGNLKAGMIQTQRNVMNLELFNFVEVEPIQINNTEVIILISVQERWYIYPVPILEIAQTNFNTWWETKEIRWLNYGVSLKHFNFRGLNQKIALTARFGYTKQFSGAYTIPNLNKKQTLGLYLSAGYYENDQIVYNTLNNERTFYRNDEEKARKLYQYKVGLSYREDIFLSHYFEISYLDAFVRDSVITLQPDYFITPETRMQFLRASYVVNYDRRDYKRYPLNGYMLYGLLQQDGLGLVNRDGLGVFTSVLGYSHHYKLRDRLYAAYSMRGKVNWTDPPYYLTRGLGYSHFVRGYELNVIDGTSYGLLRSQVKYEILKPKSIQLPFVPTEKFSRTFVALYGNIFFDAGYVDGPEFSQRNSYVNKYIYSIGVGLDLVTYYDKVMRVEGSINAEGRAAIYVHFKQAF